MINPPTRSEEIVNHALDLSEARGVAGLTTATLARRLGFTEAALYRYFPGKGSILGACLEHLAEQLFASSVLELQPEAVGEFQSIADQLTRHISRFSSRQGLLIELLIFAAAGQDAPLQDAADAFLQEYVQRLVSYFDQLGELHHIRVFAPPEEIARMWVCQLLGGFVRCRIGRESWDPINQPGFEAFTSQIRRASRHAAADLPVATA